MIKWSQKKYCLRIYQSADGLFAANDVVEWRHEQHILDSTMQIFQRTFQVRFVFPPSMLFERLLKNPSVICSIHSQFVCLCVGMGKMENMREFVIIDIVAVAAEFGPFSLAFFVNEMYMLESCSPRRIFLVRFHRRNFQLWFSCRDPEFVLATLWTYHVSETTFFRSEGFFFSRRSKSIQRMRKRRREAEDENSIILFATTTHEWQNKRKNLFNIRNRFFLNLPVNALCLQ